MNTDSQPPEDPHNPAASLPLPELVEESSFLRQIIFERRFRIAVALFFALTVFLVLFLPKWWVTSPPGFNPVIHTSGLDKVQSWSLRRSAEQRFRDGQREEAIHAWRMAILEDPCNPANSRGLIRMLIAADPPMTTQLPLGYSQGQWLLHLQGTNDADVHLLAQLYDRYQIHQGVVSLLAPRGSGISSEDAGLLLRAWYHVGGMEEFAGLWDAHPEFKTNRLLQVYRAAWQVGWGPPGGIRQSREWLEEAKKDPVLRVAAHTVLLSVSYAQNEPDTYFDSLRFLEREHLDQVVDHANYWRLLIRGGRSAQAEALVRAFVRPPAAPLDCASVAEVFAILGHPMEAADYIAKYLPTLGSTVDLWVRRAQYVVTAADWERLRDLAIEMRQVEGVRDALGGFAWYLEGVSELRRGRGTTADQAFESMMKSPLADPFLGFRTAQGIGALGRPELARKLLERLEKDFGGSADYWLQVELAAYGSDDIEGMLVAAEKAYALAPNNPIVVNNYAAALIIMRQRPAEAVKLTLSKFSMNPGDVGSRLNHALALLQNERANEAQAALAVVNPDELEGLYHTVYCLAQYELQVLKGDPAKARDYARQIQRRFLKPPQVRWLDESLKKLNP